MKTIIYLLIILFTNLSFGQKTTVDLQSFMGSNEDISSVSLDMKISSEKLEQQIISAISNKLPKGRTPKLGVFLHADESFTIEKIERILVTPAKEAYTEIIRTPKTITKSVKVGVRSYKCWINPFEWKNCAEDVFKTVTETIYEEEVKKYKAQAAIYKDVVVPFIEIQQKLIPIKGYFTYNVNLNKLKFTLDENKYNVSGVFKVRVRTNIFIENLPSNITPKGSFESTMKFKISNSGYIDIRQNGQVEISKLNSNFEITEFLDSSFIIEALEFQSKKMSVSDFILYYLGEEIDNKLNESIKKTIDEETGNINIKNLVSEVNKPTEIGDEGLFYPNLTKIFISPIQGYNENGKNFLRIVFGVIFQPFISFGEVATFESKTISDIQLSKKIEANDGIKISLSTKLSYDFLASQLKPLIADFNKKNENEFFIKNYIIENPKMTFISDSLTEIKVDILKRKSNKNIGHISIFVGFNINRKDTLICQKIDSVIIKSSDFAVNLLKGQMKKALIKSAGENECKSISKELIDTHKKIDDLINIKTDFGKIEGKIRELSLADLNAYSDHLLLKINLFGDLIFK